MGSLRDLKVSVLGLARSGLAAANWLAARGADVLVSDLRSRDELPLDRLDERVQVAAGENRVRPGDLVVISPGIRPDSETFAMAHREGGEVISDIELFSRHHPAARVAITGTDGKSTTTTMIGAILDAAERKPLVMGNIGLPVMAEYDKLPDDGVAVLEVSCFQLIHTESLRPKVAVLTNIARDHVDYHGSFEAYEEAKRRVLLGMGEGDFVVLNREDTRLDRWVLPRGVRRLTFGLELPATTADAAWLEDGDLVMDLGHGPETLMGIEELRVIGRHNLLNALAAAQACRLLGVPMNTIRRALAEFPGLEHRMEFVAEVNGVRWFNDTKATNPHAASAVLNAVDGPVILLAGGSEKGSDFEDFGRLAAERTRAVILSGETRHRLSEAIPAGHPVEVVETLAEAVKRAARLAQPGDMVILAPACASFDQFNDFEHRGREFKRMVGELTNGR